MTTAPRTLHIPLVLQLGKDAAPVENMCHILLVQEKDAPIATHIGALKRESIVKTVSRRYSGETGQT